MPVAGRLNGPRRHQPRPASFSEDIVTHRRNLRQTGVRPQLIALEITEGAVLHKRGAHHRSPTELRAMGISISLDDFGTGIRHLHTSRPSQSRPSRSTAASSATSNVMQRRDYRLYRDRDGGQRS
jgi:EAL domain-containing protein (putative c-di-GMP-specific phosphodiesterase class I)